MKTRNIYYTMGPKHSIPEGATELYPNDLRSRSRSEQPCRIREPTTPSNKENIITSEKMEEPLKSTGPK